jgi:hypothetical protein
LQCARLRTNEDISTSAFDLDRPTQIILFIVVDSSSSSGTSPINISIDFDQSSYSPSSINEIQICLLVTSSNFTINNQTTIKYASYDIPIFRWRNSTENTYDLIDLIQIGNQDYESDISFCKWNSNLWNQLFNSNISTNVSYAYFLKTTSFQLQFTLIDTSNISLLLSPPSPYLNLLYCIPYKLGTTEIVIITCFCVLIIGSVVILGILHYFKGGEDNRAQHFERYHNHHHRGTQDIFTRNHSKKVRQRSSASMSSVEHEDQNT